MSEMDLENFILQNLTQKYWCLSQENNDVMSDFIRFKEGGEIWGYSNDNEKFWSFENNIFYILNKNKKASAKFDKIEILKDGLLLTGQHILSENGPKFFLKSQLENYIPLPFAPTKKKYTQYKIGEHTYGDLHIIDPDRNSNEVLEIGKFTSLGPDIRLIAGNHNYNFVTNYPFKSVRSLSSPRTFWRPLDEIDDHLYSKKTIIGHDVWIGQSAIIKGGVTIGNGAVVAAGSVVTKDVEPYTIVGGNPARFLKRRFTEDQVDKLNKIQWWEWDDEKINENLFYIMSEDIDKFIELFYSENKVKLKK